MSDKNYCTYNVQRSSASDKASCTSEDNKCRIRKMIEVTRSTRYTTFVDDDVGEMKSVGQVPDKAGTDGKDFFSSSMAAMDSSLRSLQETFGDDKHQFAVKCYAKANQYMDRLYNIDENIEECMKTAERHNEIKAQMMDKRRQIKEKLQSVLEVSRKKRAAREKIITRLMKKMG